MNRDIATELNNLFKRKELKFDKISLENLLKEDFIEIEKEKDVKIPKVSLLKKKQLDISSFKKKKFNRKTSTLPAVKTDYKEFKLPKQVKVDQGSKLKVCMVGRKLASPIRNLKLELEQDQMDFIKDITLEKDQVSRENLNEEVEILDPILVEEEEEKTSELKLRDVDEIYKKLKDKLHEKNMELSSLRGSPQPLYFTECSSESLLEPLSLENFKRNVREDSQEKSEADFERYESFTRFFGEESYTESFFEEESYTESSLQEEYSKEEEISDDGKISKEEEFSGEEEISEEGEDGLRSTLMVKKVKLQEGKPRKILKIEPEETKGPIMPYFLRIEEDNYKPRRNIQKFVDALNSNGLYNSLESKAHEKSKVEDLCVNREGALSPDIRHISPISTSLARGSTALGMHWDPSLGPIDYPVKISEYARALLEKKDRVLSPARNSSPLAENTSPKPITVPKTSDEHHSEVDNTNQISQISQNPIPQEKHFKARKSSLLTTTFAIEEETEGELYEQKTSDAVASSVVESLLKNLKGSNAENQSDEKLKQSNSRSSIKARKNSSMPGPNRRFSVRRRSISEPDSQTSENIEEKQEAPEPTVEEVYESPKVFYLQKRRQSLGLDQTRVTSQDLLDMNRVDGTQSLNDYGSYSSLQSSVFQSIESVFLSRRESKEALNVSNAIILEQSVGSALTNGSLNPLFVALGFLDSEKPFFDRIHDLSHREMLYTPFEIYKYRTINDIGIPHDAYTEMPIEDEEILEFEKDPGKELDQLNFIIKSSPAPVPSNFRRRGYAHMRSGKYDEAIADFDKSLTYDPFNSEALWFRHQLYLKINNIELAMKDLDSLTDGNKSHLGAFDVKARIYKELGLTKLAIANFSSIIRLKPDLSYGYYQRACLYEKDQEMVYANEDFRVVREIDPLNQHAIFNHAIYNFQKQLWEDAIEAFSKLISLSPGNGLSFLFRGRSNAAISRWDEALEDLSRCIQLCPDNSQAFFHRGCLLKDRNIDQAIQDFSVSLLLDDSPLNSDAFYHRAQLYSARHEKLHAFNDYKVVVEHNPKKSSAYLELGILNMAVSKDHEQSLVYLNEAIRMDPRQLQGYLSRGELYHILYNNSLNQTKVLKEPKKSDSNKKDISELYAKKSIQDYSRAIHAFPGNYLLYLYRGRLLLKIGRMKDATSDFYTAFKLNAGIAQTFIQRALVLTFQRKYDQIVSEFDEGAKYENMSDPAVYLLIAKARVQCNDNLGALRDLDSALKIRYKDPVVHLQRGICFENLLEFKNAIDEFTEAIDIDSQFAKAYYHRGMCSMKFRKEGLDDLNKAISLDRGYFEAYLTRATYFYHRKKFKSAIADCDMALKLEPSSIHAHIMRGCCRKEVQRYESAIADFTKSIELDNGCYQAYFNRGLTYEALHDFHNAIKDYSIMILLSNDFKGYTNRGLLYWKIGDTDNAILDLEIATTLDPTDEEAKSLLALALHNVSRMEESMTVYNRAIKEHPANIDLLLGRGNVNFTLNSPELARKDYLRVLHLKPTCLQALINIGYTFQDENLYKRAWNSFTNILAINPQYHAAYEGRAIVHLAMKNTYAALLDISKAIELNPKNAEYITNRGIIYQHLGDPVSALQNFKIAIEVNPKYGLPYFNAANMYLSQNLWELALKFYDKALEISKRDVLPLTNRGFCKILQGDKEGAKNDFQLATDLQPAGTDVLFNKASMLFSEKELDEAEKIFSKVIQLDPHDFTAYRMRGEMYFYSLTVRHGVKSNWTEAITDYVKSQ